jgi:hypothetical protein
MEVKLMEGKIDAERDNELIGWHVARAKNVDWQMSMRRCKWKSTEKSISIESFPLSLRELFIAQTVEGKLFMGS